MEEQFYNGNSIIARPKDAHSTTLAQVCMISDKTASKTALSSVPEQARGASAQWCPGQQYQEMEAELDTEVLNSDHGCSFRTLGNPIRRRLNCNGRRPKAQRANIGSAASASLGVYKDKSTARALPSITLTTFGKFLFHLAIHPPPRLPTPRAAHTTIRVYNVPPQVLVALYRQASSLLCLRQMRLQRFQKGDIRDDVDRHWSSWVLACKDHV